MSIKLLLGSFVLIGFTSFVKAQCPTIANFNANPSIGCSLPHTVFFTDQSTLPDNWFWQFGDGGTSTAQNPIHTYSSTGDFIVTLTVTDTNFGCSDMVTALISIETPNADFTANPVFGCGPLTVNFSDQSTTAAAYSWNFGDGSPLDNTQNPSHVYSTPGLYDVTLTVTSSNGCTDSYTQNNYVQVIGPDVDFSSDFSAMACGAPVTVNFNDNTSASAPITSWSWNFGDGNSSTSQNPSNTYQWIGTYDVTLTVNDLDGCSRTKTISEYIVIDSIYSLTDSSTICAGEDFTFADGLTIGNIQSDTIHTSVFQTVVGGCDSAITTVVQVNLADITVTQNGLQLTVADTIGQYQWLDCDNGYAPLTGETGQSFMITTNGNYAVEVTVNGCADTSACVTIDNVGISANTTEIFVIYPNPTNSNCYIDLSAIETPVQIIIRDLTGRIVAQQIIANSGITEIKMDDQSGTYFIEVLNNDTVVGRTVVLKL